MFSSRPRSCRTSRSPTSPSFPISSRPRCSPHLSTTKSCPSGKKRSRCSVCLTPALTKRAFTTSEHPACDRPTIRGVRYSRNLVSPKCWALRLTGCFHGCNAPIINSMRRNLPHQPLARDYWAGGFIWMEFYIHLYIFFLLFVILFLLDHISLPQACLKMLFFLKMQVQFHTIRVSFSPNDWAAADEDRPHGRPPPPAGHEDRTGQIWAGLLSQTTVGCAQHRTNQ